MRTVTRIPNSFSTSTNDPCSASVRFCRRGRMSLGNTGKRRGVPLVFFVVENGGSARGGAVFSRIGNVLFLR